MGSPSRNKSSFINHPVFQEAFRYEFHQAIRILEILYPTHTRLGEGINPADEVVRISSRIDHAYPPSDIYKLELGENGDTPIQMQVNFLGIAGPNGPLPMPFSEHIIRRSQENDFASRDFLDIFNHRILSIFHRIRKKHWIGLDHSPPDKSRAGSIILSFCGPGLDSLRDKLNFPERSLMAFAGLLWQQPRSASGLEVLLSTHFRITTRVIPLQGRWHEIEKNQRTYLGQRNHQLGITASAGKRFWDQKSTIRLHMGPIGIQMFLDLLPNGSARQALDSLVSYYLGENCNHEVELELKAHEVPCLTLGKNARLGWTTWLIAGSPLSNGIVLSR